MTKNIKVKITPLEKPDNTLVAFASVDIDDEICLRSVAVHRMPTGYYLISYPIIPVYRDWNGHIESRPDSAFDILKSQLHTDIEDAVVEATKRKIGY